MSGDINSCMSALGMSLVNASRDWASQSNADGEDD